MMRQQDSYIGMIVVMFAGVELVDVQGYYLTLPLMAATVAVRFYPF